MLPTSASELDTQVPAESGALMMELRPDADVGKAGAYRGFPHHDSSEHGVPVNPEVAAAGID